jgi:hypothetical protein
MEWFTTADAPSLSHSLRKLVVLRRVSALAASALLAIKAKCDMRSGARRSNSKANKPPKEKPATANLVGNLLSKPANHTSQFFNLL